MCWISSLPLRNSYGWVQFYHYPSEIAMDVFNFNSTPSEIAMDEFNFNSPPWEIGMELKYHGLLSWNKTSMVASRESFLFSLITSFRNLWHSSLAIVPWPSQVCICFLIPLAVKDCTSSSVWTLFSINVISGWVHPSRVLWDFPAFGSARETRKMFTGSS